MKKLLAFLVAILILPSFTAYASSHTSRRFVVRNWKAAISAISTDGNLPAEDHTEEPEAPVDEQPIPPAEETEPEETVDGNNEDGASTESEQEAAMELVENETPVDGQATPLAEEPIPPVVDAEPEDERPTEDEPGEPPVDDHSGEEIEP